MPPRLRLPTYSLTSFISSSALTPRAAAVSLCRAYASKASKNTKTSPRKTKDKKDKKDKRKQRTEFVQWNLKDAQQFSLVEAVRYIRAVEVGHDPVRTKYELAVKLKTPKNGPQLRDRVRLPTPVKTDTRICVIAEGKVAQDALKAGATMAGTDEVFDLVCAHSVLFFFVGGGSINLIQLKRGLTCSKYLRFEMGPSILIYVSATTKPSKRLSSQKWPVSSAPEVLCLPLRWAPLSKAPPQQLATLSAKLLIVSALELCACRSANSRSRNNSYKKTSRHS